MISPKLFTGFAQTLLLVALLLASASPAVLDQDLAPPSDRDVWQISRRELEFLNTFQPNPQGFLIDAYVQYREPGQKGKVLSDSWKVARIIWRPDGTTVTDLGLPQVRAPLLSSDSGKQKTGFLFFHKPVVPSLAPEPALRLEGVVPMMFLDSAGIGLDRYSFQYLGVETLGKLRTWKFFLKPKGDAGPGAFTGEIWVADHDIVRFKGTFQNAPSSLKGTYTSFDSVRFKSQSGHWQPWKTYLDQTGLPPSAPGPALRARVTVWGFDAQAAGLSGTAGLQFDDNVDSTYLSGAQLSSEDVYLEAERHLMRWLAGVGFIAPAGKFERDVCDPIIEEIVDANHVTLDRTLSCRVLLSVPAETVLFESVIGISKTAFDLVPNTSAVTVLLAREVALAKVRGGHLDLAWGRPETLMLSNERDLLNHLNMTPTQIERDQADDLALKYLQHLSKYKPQDIEASAIFLYSASEACKTRPALLTPRFGDGLPGCGREAHISRMAMTAPPGSDPNPAMHVGARIKIDPWSDMVSLIAAQQENAPYEVIPEPMIPEIAPEDPDPEDGGFLPPRALPHQVPPPTFSVPRKKR